jgi:HAE1 family hydrophobic/amphiphilic exporter-1
VNFSDVFIRRPIATSLLMAALALFGVVAYRTLPVSDMPDVEMPTLQVRADLTGASPETMASSVATVLERQFTTIAGVDSMRSQSNSGRSEITLQFDIGRDVDGASVDVQTAIAEAMPLLPAGMTRPPSYRKQNPGDQAIFYLTLASDTVSMTTLADFAETIIAPNISMVSGVAQVQVQGATKYAVRVQLEPELAHRDHVWAARGLHAKAQRTTQQCRRLRQSHRRVAQRLARPPERSRQRNRQRRG